MNIKRILIIGGDTRFDYLLDELSSDVEYYAIGFKKGRQTAEESSFGK